MSKRKHTPEIATVLIKKYEQELDNVTDDIIDLTNIINKLKKRKQNIINKKKLLCRDAEHELVHMRESGPYGDKYEYCSKCHIEFY